MARPRQQTREQRLKKRRMYERRRKERIKSNAATREEFLRKDRERYAKKKGAGLIVSRSQMPQNKLRTLRSKNKISAAAYYQRKKQRAAAASVVARADSIDETNEDIDEDNPEESLLNQSDEENHNPTQSTSRPDSPSLTARSSRRNTLRRTLRSNNSISLNIQPRSVDVHTSSPRQSPLTINRLLIDNNSAGSSTSRQDNPSSTPRVSRRSVLRRSLWMNCDHNVSSECSDIQDNIDDNVATISRFVQPCELQPIAPSPNLSSIESTLCPNSPVSESSITSIEFKRGLKNKFRKYQRTKSKLITELKNKLLQATMEKEMLRKRYARLRTNYNIKMRKSTEKVEKQSVKVIKPKHIRKNPIHTRVVKFLEDDENSTLCPGKNDTVSRHGLKKQKRLLTDTLKNLHLKYLESSEPPTSYSTFSRLKPFWITQPDVSARNTCLCEKHENMKLIIQSLKRNRIIKQNTISEVLNSLCCSKDNVDCLQRTCPSCKSKNIDYQEFDNGVTVTYWNWEKNKSTYVKNNVERSAVKVEKVKHTVKPLDLIKIFETSLEPFFKHCANNKNQIQAFRTLKDNMTTQDCIIHVDFSENHNAKYGSEIQSVHFGGSRQQFTLHTAVIYFKLSDETSKTQSFCTVSTSLRHDAAAVWAHLVPILQEIEVTAPLVRNLYVISDSPSAQYRNKKILYIISQLSSYCPMLSHIVWNYCECGHGKGAADGVGGVLKRSLDKQVSYQHDITNIEALVQNLNTLVKGVKIEVVEVTEKDWLLPTNLKPFAGTMKVHQVVWSKESRNRLALRHLSCIERECRNQTIRCPHGKHLGFHNLSGLVNGLVNNINIAQLRTIQLSERLVLRPKSSQKLPSESSTSLPQNSVTNKPKIHSIQNIEIPIIKPSTSQSHDRATNQKGETGQETSMLHKSLLDGCGNLFDLSTPTCSLFEHPDFATIENYEKTSHDDSDEEIKMKPKRKVKWLWSSSSSSSDYNIFD